MTTKQYSILVLSVGLALILGLRFYLMPPPKTEQERFEAQRSEFVRAYLVYKNLDGIEKDDLIRFLKSYETDAEENPLLREALALFYGLKGENEQAQQLMEQAQTPNNFDILNYALEYAATEPKQWEERLPEDWAGAKTAALVYKRLKRETDYAAALINIRHFETNAKRYYQFFMPTQTLQLIGLGLLLSMFLSQIHWRLVGKSYFQLTPLPIPVDALFRFFGYFLLGILATSLLNFTVFKSYPSWLKQVIFTLLQSGWALYLINTQLFNMKKLDIARLMGFDNLKMRFFNLFQIVGGVAIVAACNWLSSSWTSLIGWPIDRMALGEQFKEILVSPVAGLLYMLVACIVGPIIEEIVFRGLLFRGFLAATRPWIAIFCSSLFFAVLHPIALWPIIFGKGIGLALIYYRTANIMIVIWAHALWNLTILFWYLLDATI